MFGNKGFIWNNYFFVVKISDCGGMNMDFVNIVGESVNGYGIVDMNGVFE